MFFSRNNARKVREPDETVRLSASIESVIWRETDKDGSLAIRFGINRIDPQGTVRRTFAPTHIRELVESLGALALAIGQAAGTEPALAAELKELGAGIAKLTEARTANGPIAPDRQRENRLFAAA